MLKIHVNLSNKTRFGYRYLLGALNPGTIVLLTRQTLELAVRQGDRRVTQSSSWGRYQAVKLFEVVGMSQRRLQNLEYSLAFWQQNTK